MSFVFQLPIVVCDTTREERCDELYTMVMKNWWDRAYLPVFHDLYIKGNCKIMVSA